MTNSYVKLEGPADGVLLLSAVDWLAQKKEQNSQKVDR